MSGDIAIAHKDYNVLGGGEVLAEELCRTFDAPMFVGRDDIDHDDELDISEISLTRWQQMAIDRGGAPRQLAYMLAWQRVPELTEFETVIMSGNEPLWYIPEDDQTVIAYTHSPPRFQYDLFQRQSSGTIGTTYNTAVRTLYQANITRPDLFVANSDRVARRISQYWNIPEEQIRVVYPPVDTGSQSLGAATTGDSYLYLGRLAGHKRVTEVVEAFTDVGLPLTVAGKGPEREHLEKIAGENVEFEGYVSEERKRELLSEAKALVYPPENEDFGMVPIEAMAAGTPVIGVNEGFTMYQVKHGENGRLWDRGNLKAELATFEAKGVDWSPDEIAEFATENFSVQQFRDGMREAVREARERSCIEADFVDPTRARVSISEGSQ